MRRSLVRTLMILIVGAAVGLAALRNANDLAAGRSQRERIPLCRA